MNCTVLARLIGIGVLCLALLSCGAPPSPQPAHEEVLCHAPLGHHTARRVFRWKFDVLRSAIKTALSKYGSLAPDELHRQVEQDFAPEMIESLGDVRELLFTVLLELVTRREVARIPPDNDSEIGPAYDWSEYPVTDRNR